jgi:hypothetical protein
LGPVGPELIKEHEQAGLKDEELTGL